MSVIISIIAVVVFLILVFYITGVIKRAPSNSSRSFEDRLRKPGGSSNGASGHARSSGGVQARVSNSGDRTSSNTSGDNYVYVPLMDGTSSSTHVAPTHDTPACNGADTPASNCSNPNCGGGSSCGGSSCGGGGCGS